MKNEKISLDFDYDLAYDLEEVGQALDHKTGDLYPRCKKIRLDYDVLLNLYRPKCGYSLSGC